ncbi:MAG: ABC transporter ATP-binding protein [Polyangiales bacterium]
MAAADPIPTSTLPYVVEARGIHKVFSDMGISALSGVDLAIKPGEIVALRGSSGSGKSTLLNILGCIDRPSAGTYLLGGRDVSSLDAEEAAWVRLHYLGFVFQSFHLIPTDTALENVALPLYYAGVPRKEREERAHAMLTRVGLGDRADHRPNQLSGGQRQRVAIARACVGSPRVLLADEPTGALDSRSGEEVMALLGELHTERKLTIILVTHEEEIAAFAERQVVLKDGRIEREIRNEGR